jgi:ankyrin repeat protein
LSKGVDANKADNDGNTPLMIAASVREINGTFEQLLPLVKNINTTNKKGESALTKAIQSGNSETTSLLLEKGANVKILDTNGNHLGFYLIESYRSQTQSMNQGPEGADGQKQDPFAAKTILLQDKGLNLNTPQENGNTLYHLAIIKNDLNLIKKIAPLNIDINAKNNDGLTVLHKAAMIAKDDTILKYLVSIGAKKEINTEFDETTYALAIENESLTKSKIDLEFLK